VGLAGEEDVRVGVLCSVPIAIDAMALHSEWQAASPAQQARYGYQIGLLLPEAEFGVALHLG
jgi:hypothetical protein